MIIYSKTWLENLRLMNQVKDDRHAGLINNDELKLIADAHPVGFYRPGILAVVGLFLLTCIITFASLGILSLLFAGGGALNNPIWPLILALLCYGALEYGVRNKHYLHSGIDNALLYITGGLAIGGLMWAVSSSSLTVGTANIINSFLILVACGYLTARFADLLTSAVAAFSFFALIFFIWTVYLPFGEATAPFLMIIAAGAAYMLLKKMDADSSAIHYKNCITLGLVICLLIFYAAGNYYAVNILSNKLHNWDDEIHKTIPLGWFFWIWTIALPFAYIWIGLLKKDELRIRTGLILVGAGIFTFRNYYHVLPVEYALTIGGAVLLAVAYGIIRYLKIPRHGFTYAKPNKVETFDHLQVTSLVVGETLSQLPAAPADQPSTFGGGSAGGGGSSGEF